MILTTRIKMQKMSHTMPTLTVLVQKFTLCQIVVWLKYRLSGTFYVPLAFGVVFFAKVFFSYQHRFGKM